MPSLEEILKKTKAKSDQIKVVRKPPSIATDDRPYSISPPTKICSLKNISSPSINEIVYPPPNLLSGAEISTENSTQTQHKLNTNLTQTILPPLCESLQTRGAGDSSNVPMEKVGVTVNERMSQIVVESTSQTTKPDTNLTQTRHKPNTTTQHKVHTNLTQTEHKQVVNCSKETQTEHKPNTKLNTAKTQTEHKLNTNLTQNLFISALTGHQRNLLIFIFEICKKNRSKLTEPLTLIHISNALNMPFGSIKTSIARLCEKRFISINSFKNGRGGWSIYEISNYVYTELLQMETQHKLNTNLTQTEHKPNTQPNTQPNTMLSSSSSLNIKTTTTSLPSEWSFNIESYRSFGFFESQLKQLMGDGKLTPAQVEESLAHFAYDYENDLLKKDIRSKINYLMKILRNGEEYVSDKYNDLLEAERRANVERALKRKMERLESDFILWQDSLSEDGREKLITLMPPYLISAYKAQGFSSKEVSKWLYEYYISINSSLGST